ncbi:MAG TPA: GNAT family N-acetyltransferase [Sphingomicrobium sp.]|nr:GNAT family N-acetyltransferase [Sphingomicrobium sp.]
MSEEIDELAEAARNRGLKLVRSRVRTPNKRRFGKVGLTDKAGKAVFGMDDKGPIAKPEEVQNYLRNLGARDWGASLDVAVLPRKRKPTKIQKEPANDAEPEAARAKPKKEPKREPKPPPKPMLREAKPSDAARIVELIGQLEHEIDEKSVRKNLAKLKKAGELPLVAMLGKQVVGLIGRHLMITIHRPAPVGRIPVLVVDSSVRGQNIGRMLVDAVEQWCRDEGCKLIEVTSNDRRAAAHAFYRHMGYERSSIRFFKKL